MKLASAEKGLRALRKDLRSQMMGLKRQDQWKCVTSERQRKFANILTKTNARKVSCFSQTFRLVMLFSLIRLQKNIGTLK